MDTWIFDATPLIYLSKIKYLSYVENLNKCIIPERVYKETVKKGLKQGHNDAHRIRNHIDENIFEVKTVEKNSLMSKLQENPNLSNADAAVLTYASQKDSIAVMDERYGRNIAETEKITTRGTGYLILLFCSREIITPKEARSAIDNMIEEGWYLSTKTYKEIIKKLESLD